MQCVCAHVCMHAVCVRLCACVYMHAVCVHPNHARNRAYHARARKAGYDIYDKLPANAKSYIKVCLSILRAKLTKCMSEPDINVRILKGKPGTPIPEAKLNI